MVKTPNKQNQERVLKAAREGEQQQTPQVTKEGMSIRMTASSSMDIWKASRTCSNVQQPGLLTPAKLSAIGEGERRHCHDISRLTGSMTITQFYTEHWREYFRLRRGTSRAKRPSKEKNESVIIQMQSIINNRKSNNEITANHSAP